MSTPEEVRLAVFCGATEWGGAEIVLGHLLAALPDHYQVRLLGVDETVLERLAARRPGTPRTALPPARGRDLRAVAVHRRALARAHPDLVHINLPFPFGDPYTVLAASTLWHTPVVTVIHLPLATAWSPNHRRVMRWTAPRMDAVVAVSSRAARQIEPMVGLPPGGIRVVPNGIPEPRSRRRVPVPSGRFVVGAVGRLHVQKGFDLLLRAAAAVPGVHVVLVGDGPERTALERLAAELGIAPRVSLLGWSDDASGYLRSFDVLAVPSRYEGLPLVLLEAMLAGVTVVATAVGGIPDAVQDEVSALLIPPDDVAALTAALRRLAADEPLRRRLAAAAQEAGRAGFTVDAMARSYEDLYDELRRGAPRRPRRATPGPVARPGSRSP